MSKRTSKPQRLLSRNQVRKLKLSHSECTPKPVTLRCSDCGETSKIKRVELLRASRQRCGCCGGALNRIREA